MPKPLKPPPPVIVRPACIDDLFDDPRARQIWTGVLDMRTQPVTTRTALMRKELPPEIPLLYQPVEKGDILRLEAQITPGTVKRTENGLRFWFTLPDAQEYDPDFVHFGQVDVPVNEERVYLQLCRVPTDPKAEVPPPASAEAPPPATDRRGKKRRANSKDKDANQKPLAPDALDHRQVTRYFPDLVSLFNDTLAGDPPDIQ